MIQNARPVRWSAVAILLGAAVSLTACQLSPEQLQESGASLPGLADTVRTFIEDFARQVVQAVVL